MKFTTTPDTTGLAYSPWELRPGTNVQVDYSYVAKETALWDSNSATTIDVSGFTWVTSVQSEWPIPAENITITKDGLFSSVEIQPINQGVVPLNVFYKVDVSENLTAVSAITQAASTYYNDWFEDEDGVITPLTVVPLSLPSNEQVYKPEDFEVTFDQGRRGVSVLNRDQWTCNKVATAKMTDTTDDFAITRNLFRKGLVEVLVPMASPITDITRYQVTNGAKTGKYVIMDVQEWDPIRIDVRGILWHRDMLYVMTESGLYAFDRWGDLSQPDAHYPDVTGNDLTYSVNDSFLVTDGGSIKVYKVRHDFNHYDRPNATMRNREIDPNFLVEE